MPDSDGNTLGRRLDAAFRREERNGLSLALGVRTAALVAIVAYLALAFPVFAILWPIRLCGVFIANGVAAFLLLRSPRGRAWQPFLFVAIDALLLAFTVLSPNPLFAEIWPQPMALRFGSFIYFGIIVALTALSYSYWLVLWAGVVCIAAWVAGVVAIMQFSDHFTEDAPRFAGLGLLSDERLALILQPRFISLETRLQEIVVLTVLSGILATVVWRSRRLVRRQALAERARANLARYFSPNMVDELAGTDAPLGAARDQDAAVLFADIVGFTAMFEARPAADALDLLREFHGRAQTAVLAHKGTLDKYIGDAVMATFGTPQPGVDDTARALACARTLVAAIAAWNRERAATGAPPVEIGIGVHVDPVVLGDIGGGGRLEFAVIGNTVNVTSRLERLTRELDAVLCVSDAAVQRARAECPDTAPLEDGLVPGPAQTIRGLSQPMDVWLLPRSS